MAIGKEIEIIKNRKYQHFKSIKNDLDSIKKSTKDWFNYNIYLTETQSLKRSIRSVLMISIILGLIIGVFTVLIDDAIQLKKTSKKNK